jgi:2-oxo-hept-3-ene-1,7-dioate hydratase
MTLSGSDVIDAAARLLQAEQTGRQIGLLSLQYPALDMDDAYAIQSELMRRKLDQGRQIVGWKIGLTSKAMRDALKIDIPDSGVLFDDMVFENGTVVPAGRFIQPRIEAEIAFVMKSELSGRNISRVDVIQATDYVVPSLEILDTRILRKDPDSGALRVITDTIADNAANAGIVVGSERHAIDTVDLRWVGAIVSRNGEVEETGLGAGVLNDPAAGIVWLANRMGAYNQVIKPGDVVLSGSFVRPVEAPSGALIEADFGPFGAVSCQFE